MLKASLQKKDKVVQMEVGRKLATGSQCQTEDGVSGDQSRGSLEHKDDDGRGGESTGDKNDKTKAKHMGGSNFFWV